MKKVTLTSAKKKAWDQFSEYIRRKYAGKSGMVVCVTCGTAKHWKQMQAGHYVDGRNNSILFDERLVHPQCLTEESNLESVSGSKKSIKDIKTGNRVWGFDEKTFKKRVAIVEGVSSFMPKKLYKVTLSDGSIFYATPDHKVVSNGAWYNIKEMLHNVSSYDILKI